jgi:hypothetical protein
MPLCPGDIVHLYVQSLANPKNKFAIIACVEPKVLFLLISSEMTEFVQSQDEIRAGHILILAAEHTFLRYDSWVNCVEPHSCDRATLERDCDRGASQKVGKMSGNLLLQLLQTVSATRLLATRDKNRILSAFAQTHS